MDISPAMILPKGIVVNTSSIYDEVAGYSILPLDKVWRIWQVYTTTYKKLKDPTARRLENFWWHVLGSDRQRLSGRALAKLYEEISVGPTFVPLRGPPNRWEGYDVIAGTGSNSKVHEKSSLNEEDGASSTSSKQSESHVSTQPSASSLKTLSSSASKPPPAHPILKKTMAGSLSSGPRPTARFATPPESAGEDDKDSDVPSSGSTAVAGNEMRSLAAAHRKKTAKKFVASSSKTSKRRPVLARRPSSQSSTGSENNTNTSTNQGSSVGGRTPEVQRPVSPIPEKPSTCTTPQSQEDQPLLVNPPSMSAKAAGKRPMQRVESLKGGRDETGSMKQVGEQMQKEKEKEKEKKKKSRERKGTPDLTSSDLLIEQEALCSPMTFEKRTEPLASPGYREPLASPGYREPLASPGYPGTYAKPVSVPSPIDTLSQVQSMIDLTAHRRRGFGPPIIGTDATLSSSHSPAILPLSPSFTAPAMGRSSSHAGYERSAPSTTSWDYRRPPSSGLFTKTTASTTNIAALGTIIDQSGVGSLPDAPSALSHGINYRSTGFDDYPSPLHGDFPPLDARMTPTQPSTSVNVPLGRTKSQLTLLLERDQARTGNHSRSRG